MVETLRLHSRGPTVTKLQLLLDEHLPLHQRLKPDGMFGTRTRDAVIAFQKQKGLAADGVVGAATLKALGVKSAEHGPPPAPLPAPSGDAPWMAIAEAELGIHRDKVSHHEKRILEYLRTTSLSAALAGTDSTAWCSAFVNWVMIKSGRKGTNNALAASWLDWKKGRAVDPPVYGAIVVIKKKGASSDKHTGSTTGNHVGFCVSLPIGHVRLLGGNQGSQVSYVSFPLSRWDVRGARWPA
jgi:uncharacterized protein (TIGR02594 family)